MPRAHSGFDAQGRPVEGMPVKLNGEVHAWWAELSLPPVRMERLARTLSQDELRRAARLTMPGVATRFVAARGLLRELLGHYLGVEPAAVRLTYEERGKPCLHPPAPLHFNVSHAGDHALFVLSSPARVGADVEILRSLPHAERIARRTFGEEELRTWLQLPPGERLPGFFERWTRMEALAKLLGHGVWRLLADRGLDANSVVFHSLEAPRGLMATLAVDRPDVGVVARTLRG